MEGYGAVLVVAGIVLVASFITLLVVLNTIFQHIQILRTKRRSGIEKQFNWRWIRIWAPIAFVIALLGLWGVNQ